MAVGFLYKQRISNKNTQNNKMPEGPEVKITSDGIRSEILDFELIGIEINQASRYYKSFINKEFKNINSINYPILITNVFSKGKKILIKGNDFSNREITFISALAMEGSWKLYPGKHSGIELYFRKNNEYKLRIKRVNESIDINL